MKPENKPVLVRVSCVRQVAYKLYPAIVYAVRCSIVNWRFEMMLANLEYIELGPSPFGEDCVQVGEKNYRENASNECKRYVSLLEEMFPTDNPNNFFEIMGANHDFGTYYEVVVYFDPTDTKSVDFAYKVESNLPEYWA